MWTLPSSLRAVAKPSARTDGALVRLITPVYPNEGSGDAGKRLAAFTQAIVPVLNEYLPK
jgi:hypothetical protein